jgi:cation-transporting ATPase E
MTPPKGLTAEEVAIRIKSGQSNHTKDKPSRTIPQILRANFLTRFNAIFFVLTVIVLIVGDNRLDALFGLIIIVNSSIGVFQELKSKLTLDRLTLLNSPKVIAIRDGKEQEIATSSVVIDDILHIKTGDQIVADATAIISESLEIDESLLTGESDPVIKSENAKLLSGSLVVAGSAYIKVTTVGAATYANKLTKEAKIFKRANSELVTSTNKLLKYLSWILFIAAPLTVITQLRFRPDNWHDAVVRSAAAITGLIPEGLVLLTSLAFLVAIMKLARKNVLVQQLPAVETLARVDTLLLDKTGTLTEGIIEFNELIALETFDAETVEVALATLASRTTSPTNSAIAAHSKHHKPVGFSAEVPFNSSRKWSAITIKNQNYILGAPDILLKNHQSALKQATEISATGKRVLVLLTSKTAPTPEQLPVDTAPLALIVLSEKIRPDAPKTLRFFADQGVDIKIISGDNPLTVAAIARKIGLESEPFDARDLPKGQNQLQEILKTHNIFGRVQPAQKKRIVEALKAEGKTVAMTGDGVNDALALKTSDLGIAMATGASATKSVAEVVLLDNQFSSLPSVLAEGRRVIANIERSANLFLIKNTYSLTLILLVTLLALPFPYLPSQLMIVSTLVIGLPSFLLALAPNTRLYKSGFMKRVLQFSIPVGLTSGLGMLIIYLISTSAAATLREAGTAAAIFLFLTGAYTIFVLSRPIRPWKLLLVISILFVFALFLATPFAPLFRYQLNPVTFPIILLASFLAVIIIEITYRILKKSQNPTPLAKPRRL